MVLEMAVCWIMRCRDLVVVAFLHGRYLHVVFRVAGVLLAFVAVSTSLLLLLVVAMSTCVRDAGRFVQVIFIFMRFRICELHSFSRR